MTGIPIEFISQERLDALAFDEKLNMILSEVKQDKILVLEEALSPEEKRKLIEGVLEEVDEDFPGIEFSGLESEQDTVDKLVDNIYSVLGRNRRRGLTIVGNSDIMEEVETEQDSVSLLAKSQQQQQED